MTAARDGAIIGFGNVAAHGHVPGWRERSDFRIVAVTDPDPSRRALAQELLPGVRAYSHTDDLLRCEHLDFVDIAAPPAFHSVAIVAAARAGVHVLCEKPLTSSLHEYEAVRATVQQADVVLYTVNNWKYSEAFRTVRQLLADGALGVLNTIAFDTARDGCAAATADNWRVRAALAGGGILVDHGWHAFYLMQAFANQRPRRIRATLERHRYLEAEVEDTAACAVDFPSVRAEIRLTWAATERHTSWRFVGSDGELLVDDDQVVVQGKGAGHSHRLGTALSAGSHHPDWFSGVVDGFAYELDHREARGVNQAEAELCLLMLDRAYASNAQDSCMIDIPAVTAGVEGSVALS